MVSPLRAVLVGCGGISQSWLKPIQTIEGLTIVGLVDILPDNAKKRAEQFEMKDVEIGGSLPAMLDHTQPDIVFDCTVPEAHMDVTMEALGRGCHVLGEKPMADTMINARRMLGMALSSGKTYAVMQNRRYLPDIRAVQAFLRQGEIGPLTTVNCDFYLGPHFGGFREQMMHVLLVDMAIHTFDQARFLSGADPVSVYCKEWNPKGSWYQHGASAVAIFEMSNGVVFTYRGSWAAEGKPTTWEADWRIIGQHGTVVWDGGKNMSAETAEWKGKFFSEATPKTIAPYEGPKVDGHGGLIRNFVECIRTGETPETICTDNIKSLAMVFGAVESAAENLPVKISQ